MNDLLSLFILSFVSLFVTVDPVGLIPTFAALTQGRKVQERNKIARTTSIATFVILMLFFVFGQWIFKFFQITLPAFQIAGGFILMIIALDMLQGKTIEIQQSDEEVDAAIQKQDVALTPLSIPMLAGPGSITTVIVLSRQVQSGLSFFTLAADIFLICVLTFVILRYAVKKMENINLIHFRIMTRIMGLILSAISVQFILDGVQEATNLW